MYSLNEPALTAAVTEPGAVAAPDPEQYRAAGEAAQLIGRMGCVEEVGRLCLFIAAEATFTTGVDHIISGGAELGYAQKSTNGRVHDVELALSQT